MGVGLFKRLLKIVGLFSIYHLWLRLTAIDCTYDSIYNLFAEGFKVARNCIRFSRMTYLKKKKKHVFSLYLVTGLLFYKKIYIKMKVLK